MMKADMHVHTTASDGVYTPSVVVEMAGRLGLAAIAITDHDTMAGVPEALEAASRVGIEVVPGVEISTQLDGQDIHILGYYVDVHNRELAGRLQQLRQAREERNARIIEKLNELGIEKTVSAVWKTVKKEAERDLRAGHPHLRETRVGKRAA